MQFKVVLVSRWSVSKSGCGTHVCTTLHEMAFGMYRVCAQAACIMGGLDFPQNFPLYNEFHIPALAVSSSIT